MFTERSPIHINDSKQSDRKHLVYHVTIHQFAQAFLPSMREQLYGGKTSWHSVSTINAKRLKMAFKKKGLRMAGIHTEMHDAMKLQILSNAMTITRLS